MLEKGWNKGFPYDMFKKQLVDIDPTERNCKIILENARHLAKRFLQDSFKYEKERWDKGHQATDCKVGDLVLVSTLKFNKFKRPKRLKDYFSGPFIIISLHSPNSVQL
ncbi:hypothetical protein O181_044286 [Austropuccinia psidii MF-1]|uniref:Uncharacterized protein n=1 Tax=Austropuccinia psidii MF-1 TaxID=1389203 RepID=A0A9Q3DI69_9BASI|nr:hypothetical protein [Austropuccinia psidii MF-1]